MAVELTYFGHSAFQLTDGSTTVLVDPFLTGNPVATTRGPMPSSCALPRGRMVSWPTVTS